MPRNTPHGLIGSSRNARTEALNQRLAQLEQFYAETAAAARHHTLTGQGAQGGRPHSALAGHYSDRGDISDPGFDPLGRRDRQGLRPQHPRQITGLPPLQQQQQTPSRSRDDSALNSKISRVPSTSAIYETIRKNKMAQESSQRQSTMGALEDAMGLSGPGKTTSLPRQHPSMKSYGDDRIKDLNQELNARFVSIMNDMEIH